MSIMGDKSVVIRRDNALSMVPFLFQHSGTSSRSGVSAPACVSTAGLKVNPVSDGRDCNASDPDPDGEDVS